MAPHIIERCGAQFSLLLGKRVTFPTRYAFARQCLPSKNQSFYRRFAVPFDLRAELLTLACCDRKLKHFTWPGAAFRERRSIDQHKAEKNSDGYAHSQANDGVEWPATT